MQIIYNISLNSIKYTFKGNITIQFNATNNGMLSVKIQDTGIGISSDELNQINKLFGLLERKSANNETGIGLGLLVSKNIVTAMNGTLNMTSKVGIGTISKIKIPIIRPEKHNVHWISYLDII